MHELDCDLSYDFVSKFVSRYRINSMKRISFISPSRAYDQWCDAAKNNTTKTCIFEYNKIIFSADRDGGICTEHSDSGDALNARAIISKMRSIITHLWIYMRARSSASNRMWCLAAAQPPSTDICNASRKQQCIWRVDSRLSQKTITFIGNRSCSGTL